MGTRNVTGEALIGVIWRLRRGAMYVGTLLVMTRVAHKHAGAVNATFFFAVCAARHRLAYSLMAKHHASTG